MGPYLGVYYRKYDGALEDMRAISAYIGDRLIGQYIRGNLHVNLVFGECRMMDICVFSL